MDFYDTFNSISDNNYKIQGLVYKSDDPDDVALKFISKLFHLIQLYHGGKTLIHYYTSGLPTEQALLKSHQKITSVRSLSFRK